MLERLLDMQEVTGSIPVSPISKIERLACRKYLPKESGKGSIRLSIRLLRILTNHNFDMGNIR